MTRSIQGVFRWSVRIAIAALALVAGGVLSAHSPQPANASVSSAIELADKALSASTALEDESPYNMIDAIGPGGITTQQAVEEVTSRTMLGGLPAPSGNVGPYGGSQ